MIQNSLSFPWPQKKNISPDCGNHFVCVWARINKNWNIVIHLDKPRYFWGKQFITNMLKQKKNIKRMSSFSVIILLIVLAFRKHWIYCALKLQSQQWTNTNDWHSKQLQKTFTWSIYRNKVKPTLWFDLLLVQSLLDLQKIHHLLIITTNNLLQCSQLVQQC